MKRGLKVLGHLDRYVGSLFLASYATSFFAIVGLFLILDMASKIDDYLKPWPDGSPAPVDVLVRYYLLTVPFVFLQFSPFVTFVAGLFTVSRLLRYSEAVAALAAGISAHRLLAPVFLGAAFFGACMFGLRELASWPLLGGASLADKRDAYLYLLEEQTFDRVYKNLWLRDLSGSVVLLEEFRPATGEPPMAEARGVQATLNSSRDWVTIEAERALFARRGEHTGWLLQGGLRREVSGEKKVLQVERLEGFEFTPELALSFHRGREKPLELSFGEALALSKRDPDSVVYRTLLQYHLTLPLANIVLLLVGVPLLMRYERGKGAHGLAAACFVCAFYFSVDFVCRNLGLGGNLDPQFAAWTPVLLFGALGAALYDGMRT